MTISLPRSTYGTLNAETLNAQMQLTNKPVTNRLADLLVVTDVASSPAASITTTNLYKPQTGEAAVYQVNIVLVTTSPGGAGTATLTLGWNNGAGAQTFTTSTIDLTVAGSEVNNTLPIYVAVGETITYATTVAGAAGNPVYAAHLRVLFMQ